MGIGIPWGWAHGMEQWTLNLSCVQFSVVPISYSGNILKCNTITIISCSQHSNYLDGEAQCHEVMTRTRPPNIRLVGHFSGNN